MAEKLNIHGLFCVSNDRPGHLPEDMFDFNDRSVWHCAVGECAQNGYVNMTFKQPILMEYIRVYGRSCCWDDCNCASRYTDICLYVDAVLARDKNSMIFTLNKSTNRPRSPPCTHNFGFS